ncbi:hypothetical protein [Streptomyces sedi]|uniref:Uncharacterized protein n=1 Tax=Streptomyces sedi TaxID=555059 RepID=A0A5C4VDT0_9ACTN|nr:hypothetical protein [Streptomyces sedi]TNM34134.1 hypothetical protein FH715_00025 [Streptomyces sedi]
MAGSADLRKKAAFAVARDLARPETRELFADNGFPSQSNIIVTLESDTVEEVFDRVRRDAPPVTVAIYWPATERLEYTSFRPGDQLGDRVAGTEDVGATATIGMLFDHVERQDTHGFRFNLVWERPAMKVARFESALR